MDYRDDVKGLITILKPGEPEPPLPESQVPLYDYLIAHVTTDPAQKIMAQAALDARRPVRVLNSILYCWPNIKA